MVHWRKKLVAWIKPSLSSFFISESMEWPLWQQMLTEHPPHITWTQLVLWGFSVGQGPTGGILGQMSEDAGLKRTWGGVCSYVEGNVQAGAWASHRLDFKSWSRHSLHGCLWVSYLSSLSFNSCIFNMSKIAFNSQDSYMVRTKRHCNCKVLSTGLTHRST